MPKLLKDWQVGDGREDRLLSHVLQHARAGDIADAIRVIDAFAWNQSFLINVGDEKGLILDAAVRRADPRRILELGTYCGYSALRMALSAPAARITSIEFSAANATIARRIFEHVGVGDRITVVVGTLGNQATVDELKREHDFSEGGIDLVFIDHAKEAYLPDLQLIERENWLRSGGLVVADNVKFPGAPDYHAYMKQHHGRRWQVEEHAAKVEYQGMLKDLVLISERLSG